MDYLFNPAKYHFNPSELYPELDGFFGSDAHVKVIASREPEGHCWYKAVKLIKQLGSVRYSVSYGLFTKGQIISEREWPRECYMGLISSDAFAEELLKHLMGTLKIESVEKEGLDRLHMECLYLNPPTEKQS